MEDSLKESYHPIVLVSESFIEKIKEKREHPERRREMPSTRMLSEYDRDTVMAKRFELKSEINHEIKELMQRMVISVTEG